jgi:hypothetical protein
LNRIGQYSSVIDRYESQKFAIDSVCLKEYLLALTKLDRFDRIDQALAAVLAPTQHEATTLLNKPGSPSITPKGKLTRLYHLYVSSVL